MSTSPESLKQSLPSSLDSRDPSGGVSRTPTLAVGLNDALSGKEFNTELDIVSESAAAYPSPARRKLLLALFAAAQFVDVALGSGVVIGIEKIAHTLRMGPAESSWIVNAYALTLAAFLLTGGRLADMFSAKWVFTLGFGWVGVFSLGLGFVSNNNTFIVLRALQGIGAGMTIPAALRMIVIFFPPEQRPIAIAVFGASGAIANVLGVVLGGVLLLASWHWIFWSIAIICIPLSVVSAFFTPSTTGLGGTGRTPKFDYLGTFLMISSFVLVIFGMTQGNIGGWNTGKALGPLLVGIALFPLFFVWESRMDPFDALIDPKIWRIRNVLLISIISLVPYFWWFLVQVSYAQVMQAVWHDSAVLVGARFLPTGIAGGVMAALAGAIPLTFPLKWRFVVGCLASAGAALMLAFADSSSDYWRLIFPASIIGSAGTALTFITGNIALMMSIPSEFAGVAGGIFNSSLQLGVVIGLSISTALQVSYPAAEGSPLPAWKGYQSAFFFLMASMLLAIVLVLAFFKDPVEAKAEDEGVPVKDLKAQRPPVAIV